jgi:hypothetical protein
MGVLSEGEQFETCGVVCFDPRMEIAALVIALLSAAGTVWAAWYARAQKVIAKEAAGDAKRSADAAAEVAKIERDRRSEEVAAADASRVDFELVRRGGDSWLLRNKGTESAFGVHVDPGNLRSRGEMDFDEFPAREARRYLFVRTLGSDQTDHVLVTWHHLPDLSDPPRQQKLYGP